MSHIIVWLPTIYLILDKKQYKYCKAKSQNLPNCTVKYWRVIRWLNLVIIYLMICSSSLGLACKELMWADLIHQADQACEGIG